MRFLSVVIVAVAGLFAGHVRGQFNDGLGLMNGLAPRSWPLAVAKPPLLGKRDGSCASGSHPCMRSTFAVVSDRFISFLECAVWIRNLEGRIYVRRGLRPPCCAASSLNESSVDHDRHVHYVHVTDLPDK